MGREAKREERETPGGRKKERLKKKPRKRGRRFEGEGNETGREVWVYVHLVKRGGNEEESNYLPLGDINNRALLCTGVANRSLAIPAQINKNLR